MDLTGSEVRNETLPSMLLSLEHALMELTLKFALICLAMVRNTQIDV